MDSKARVLVIDDDMELCAMLVEYLGSDGFTVTAVHNGVAGQAMLKSGEFDIAILDVMLPGMGGIDVLRAVRPTVSIPVVMLTARGEPASRIVGLELGADDYIAKPFDPRELLARLNAVLRRTYPTTEPDEVRAQDFVIQLSRRAVLLGNCPVALTTVEFDLLAVLAAQQGKVVDREALSFALGRKLLPFDRSIDMHIVNLRRKLGPLPDGSPRIVTIRAVGYLLTAGEAP